MAQHPTLSRRKKRCEAYENLLCSLETENDTNEITLEKPTNLEFDRSYNFFFLNNFDKAVLFLKNLRKKFFITTDQSFAVIASKVSDQCRDFLLYENPFRLV